jgi:hypothetical protein
MVERAAALEVLDQLHHAQNAFYAGGSDHALRLVLASDILWTVPGDNAIAGAYRGLGEVLAYFSRRRELSGATFQLHRRDVLVGEGSRVVALTDGTATVDGVERSWSTAGLYDLVGARVAACWLLPLDPTAFDEVWSG